LAAYSNYWERHALAVMKERVLNVFGVGYIEYEAPEFTAEQHRYCKLQHSSTIHEISLVSSFRTLPNL